MLHAPAASGTYPMANSCGKKCGDTFDPDTLDLVFFGAISVDLWV